MPMTATPAGREVPWLGRFGWAMFDWANQPFFTVIVTFIFAPYFSSVVIGDPVRGQAYWGYTQSTAGVTIALLSPFLGAIADARGPRKRWIFAFQALTVAGCMLLWWAIPGRPDLIALTFVAVILATIGAEFSIVFNNALLPSLVASERMGRLSGFGWGMGYLGGIVALIAVLVVSRPELIGITPPEGEALLGLDRAGHEAERLVGPASAVWLMVFVLPMFLFTPDMPESGLGRREAVREGLRHLVATVRGLGTLRNQALFLVAYMIYNDGLLAVIAFGGIYAAGTFGWGTTELGIFGIILTVIAAGGCFAGGWLDDHIGSRRTVLTAIGLVGVASLGIMSLTADSAFFFLPLVPVTPGGALFASPQEKIFLGFAIVLGIGMGPMQSASRTMIGRLAPPGMIGEFYGLFALSGRATTFLAPFFVAVTTQAFASQRAGLAVVLAFLVVGFALLTGVREPRPQTRMAGAR
jgi:UMF1 family MFS transporter